MLIPIFGLLMAPDSVSCKTIDVGDVGFTVSQHSKENMLLNKLLEEWSILENTIQI